MLVGAAVCEQTLVHDGLQREAKSLSLSAPPTEVHDGCGGMWTALLSKTMPPNRLTTGRKLAVSNM